MILTQERLEHFAGVVNNEDNPVLYLGIDPGKSNGICGYDAKYYLSLMLTVPSDKMVQVMEMFEKVQKTVMENYLLYPNKMDKQIYSDMETPRVIGRVEAWAERKGVELIMQGASIKPTGYKWIGKKPLPKSNPANHELDAHVHFMYWAVKHHKINAAQLLRT